MDTTQQLSTTKVCKNHNQAIVLFDKQQNQPLCLICVQEKTGMVSIDQISQQLEEIKIHSNEEFQKEEQQLQHLWDSILLYKQNFINGIDKITQIVMDQIKNIRFCLKQFNQQLESSNQQNTLDQLNNQIKNQQVSHYKIIVSIKILLQDFQQKYLNIDHLNLMLTESAEIKEMQVDNTMKADQTEVQELIQEKIQNLGKIQYELIEESGRKQSTYCYTMAFSKDKTNLLVGCGFKIKIFEFINGKIGKELQVLQNHKNNVYCLYIMQQSNSFVSGSKDKSIIIWKQDYNSQWAPQQILTDHQDTVSCLLMNKNEDLLISGSWDNTIKFLRKVNYQWTCYQTIETDNQVYAMNFNQFENKLITCGTCTKIYVMETQNNKQWNIIQKIDVNERGYRLCFTNKDQFIFQPRTQDYLEIYDFENSSYQFIKTSQVQIQECNNCFLQFPCLYIKQLNILFVKMINENMNYELIQTIRFEDQYYLCGTVSDDGEYLITWDNVTKEIQVREGQLMNE